MQPPSDQTPYGYGGSPYGAPQQAPYAGQQQYAPPQQQAPYGPPPQQAPYGAPPAQPLPYGAQQASHYGPQCRFCGCVPAAETTFRGHRGMILMMSFLHTKGPFCRDCGLAVFRDMTAKTLIGGWWGYISFIATPVTVLINLTRHGKVASLAPPMPPPDGSPHRHPADPGPPLMSRPIAIIGALVPALLIILIILIGVA
ncbi:hypothetical protein [Actinomadura napierensis]|uniref:Toxin-antitoxin system, toxin component n=1 Tax=Actinomadura napierensis TaxID=267854 RepID=A0ABP5KIC8_9ACTN